MSSKRFPDLSEEECMAEYPAIIDQAEKHWSTALLVAEAHQNYGLGISTMIISMEELIKAMILFADAHGFEFRKVKGMALIFRNHQIRYLIMYIGFIMGIFGDELKKLMLHIIKDPRRWLEISRLIKNNDSEEQKKLTNYVFRKFVVLRSEYRWFKKIDALRQSGLYSDFNDSLKRPSDLSKEDFDYVLERLGKVKTICLAFIDAITNIPDPQVLKVLDDLRADTKAAKRYDQLASWLVILKKHKYDAFTAFHSAVKV
jgi:AbiV family abortive infection protein